MKVNDRVRIRKDCLYCLTIWNLGGVKGTVTEIADESHVLRYTVQLDNLDTPYLFAESELEAL